MPLSRLASISWLWVRSAGGNLVEPHRALVNLLLHLQHFAEAGFEHRQHPLDFLLAELAEDFLQVGLGLLEFADGFLLLLGGALRWASFSFFSASFIRCWAASRRFRAGFCERSAVGLRLSLAFALAASPVAALPPCRPLPLPSLPLPSLPSPFPFRLCRFHPSRLPPSAFAFRGFSSFF